MPAGVSEPELDRAAVLAQLDRTLGTQVFGREPDYDTNLDPVVRTTAAEIRKRLAQYYQDPAHEAERRIELPTGSYASRFRAALPLAPPTPTKRSKRGPRRPAESINPTPGAPSKSLPLLSLPSPAGCSCGDGGLPRNRPWSCAAEVGDGSVGFS